MGINSKGSFIPDARIASWRTGAEMQIDEHLKPMRSLSSGAGMFATSLADSQSDRSVTARDHDLAICESYPEIDENVNCMSSQTQHAHNFAVWP